MTQQEILVEGRKLSEEAGVTDTLHKYFISVAPRIYKSCDLFHLLERPLGDVLELGPFYGYLPFFLRSRASSYTVVEGDDPVVHALEPLYKSRQISLHYLDFFDLFGPVAGAPRAIPFPDNQFDTIICWEMMEHFNFNPVPFVRDLYRILKPGGRAYISVPNQSSLAALVELCQNSSKARLIESFYTYENYESNGKKAFYGFHWREYLPAELKKLFARAGFEIEDAGTFTVFRPKKIPLHWQALRVAYQAISWLIPRLGSNVHVVARKPS